MKVQMTSLTSNQNCGVALLTKEKHCVYITLWGITYEIPNLFHTHYGFAYYNNQDYLCIHDIIILPFIPI